MKKHYEEVIVGGGNSTALVYELKNTDAKISVY